MLQLSTMLVVRLTSRQVGLLILLGLCITITQYMYLEFGVSRIWRLRYNIPVDLVRIAAFSERNRNKIIQFNSTLPTNAVESTVSHGSTRVTSSSRNPVDNINSQKSKNRQLIAVGWFTHEQLTQGCMQFSDILDAGMKLKRNIVAVRVFGNHVVGIGGPQRIIARYPAETKNSEMIPLETYFDLDGLRKKLAKHKVRLISEQGALKTCYKKWTLLLISNSINSWMLEASLCKSKALQDRYFNTMLNLSQRAANYSSQSKQLPIAFEDCTWITECLDRLFPHDIGKPKIVCLSTDSKGDIQLPLSSVIRSVLPDAMCLLIVNWFGSTRHWMTATPEGSLPMLEVNFPPAQILRNISSDLIRSSGLNEDRGYTSVHIRFEYMQSQCRQNNTLCGVDKQDWTDFSRSCLQDLLEDIQLALNHSDRVVLGLDNLSHTVFKDKKLGTLFRKFQLQVNSAVKGFGSSIIPIEQVYRDDILPNYAKIHLLDQCKRALVDQLLFSSAKAFVGVGGGNFQGRVISRRFAQRSLSPNSIDDRVVCSSFSSKLFPIKLAGRRIVSVRFPQV